MLEKDEEKNRDEEMTGDGEGNKGMAGNKEIIISSCAENHQSVIRTVQGRGKGFIPPDSPGAKLGLLHTLQRGSDQPIGIEQVFQVIFSLYFTVFHFLPQKKNIKRR